jgi:protein involved in sex pheromone biosynthesis
MEMEILLEHFQTDKSSYIWKDGDNIDEQRLPNWCKPSSMTDREWKEFLGKLSWAKQ